MLVFKLNLGLTLNERCKEIFCIFVSYSSECPAKTCSQKIRDESRNVSVIISDLLLKFYRLNVSGLLIYSLSLIAVIPVVIVHWLLSYSFLSVTESCNFD